MIPVNFKRHFLYYIGGQKIVHIFFYIRYKSEKIKENVEYNRRILHVKMHAQDGKFVGFASNNPLTCLYSLNQLHRGDFTFHFAK